MDLLRGVAVALTWIVAYLALGAIVGRVIWMRSLRAFGRDRTSLDGYEQSALFRLCLLVVLGWLPVLIVLAASRMGERFKAELAHLFSQRFYAHVSEDLDAPPWQCALARGRQRDDVAELEASYTVSAPSAGTVQLVDGGLHAEIHTVHCPGCKIVMFRTALVRYRDGADGQVAGEVVEASPWMPQEHDVVWSTRTTAAGRRALEAYVSA